MKSNRQSWRVEKSSSAEFGMSFLDKMCNKNTFLVLFVSSQWKKLYFYVRTFVQPYNNIVKKEEREWLRNEKDKNYVFALLLLVLLICLVGRLSFFIQCVNRSICFMEYCLRHKMWQNVDYTKLFLVFSGQKHYNSTIVTACSTEHIVYVQF